ncbi:hypothetical protein P879_12066 [Paragonimus westermani]|uniref:Uncharacterized protein n=1 Tax=Paragonimus westermani TaxID=34504 RepID=A0A8T0D959_9TREM|nr:hypothetical protein P879_12066 [Paragonimus westermani]
MLKFVFVLVLCTAVVCPLEATSHGVKSDALNRGQFNVNNQETMFFSIFS